MTIDTELIKNIQTIWEGKTEQTEQTLIDTFIEAGTKPDNRDEIRQFLQENPVQIDLGISIENIISTFADTYRRNLQAQKEKRKKLEADKKLQNVKAFLEDYSRNKDNLTAADLKAPVSDLLKTVKDLDAIVSPPRLNLQDLLTPTTKNEIVKQIKNKPPALETGYQIDGGPLRFQTGALSIIAAPTGHGKTTFLLNLLLDAAEHYPNLKHWLFSYEEGKAAVTLKALSVFCNNDYSKDNRRTFETYYRTGKNDYFLQYNNVEAGEIKPRFQDFQEKEPAFWELVERGVINVIQADYSTEELLKAIRTVSGYKAGLVAIDYLQLLYPDNRDRYTARTEELKRICLELKDAAVETGLPIVAAAQFNREVRYPGAMEPQRIADASDIEKAANKVIGLWNGDKKPGNDREAEKDIKNKGITAGTMYLEVLKARDEKSEISGLYPWNGNRGVIGKTPSAFTDNTGPEGPEEKRPVQNNSINEGDYLA